MIDFYKLLFYIDNDIVKHYNLARSCQAARTSEDYKKSVPGSFNERRPAWLPSSRDNKHLFENKHDSKIFGNKHAQKQLKLFE